MTWTKGSAELFTDARHFGEGQLRERIHFLDRRSKDEICASPPAQFQIFRQSPGIFRVILAGPELQRIDKDADGDQIRSLSCGLDQLLMSGMKGAHRRDKPNRFAGSS